MQLPALPAAGARAPSLHHPHTPLPSRPQPLPRSVGVGTRQQHATTAASRGQPQICGFRRSADWHAKRASTASKTASPPTGARPGPRRDFLEARQVSLLELFDSCRFDIPVYQRPYSWRSKQVYELLSDLQTAYLHDQEYFLGAIVTTKPEDGATSAYQVIDGQQRLTTLLMMLAFLHHWAARQEDGASLAQRVRRMLHLDADPLDPTSKDRYRLHLRPADQRFFKDNILEHWLPFTYHLAPTLDSPAAVASGGPGAHQEDSGLMEEQEALLELSSNSVSVSVSVSGSASAAVSRLGSSGVGLGRAHTGASAGTSSSSGSNGNNSNSSGSRAGGQKSYPLANEAWWRMYCAGRYIDRALTKSVADGMALPEFMFHMLHNCYIVVMTARDEDASFRIFSTLNGRGMDLSVVDVLKAELMQALTPEGRAQYSDRWLEMESALGRPGFHKLFDYIQHVELAAAAPGFGTSSSNGSYEGQQQWHQRSSQSLLEHWSAKAGSAEEAEGAMDVLFEYAHRLLLIRQNNWTALEQEGGSGPQIAADLEEVCWYMNLFSDNSWAPWALEFFYQVMDEDKRAAFLRGAEVLQLYCELHLDAAFRQDRWDQVGAELLKRPFYSDRVLNALALSTEEQRDMVHRLGSKNLAAETESRTLAHLLLRADSINRKTLDWRRIKVEKISPSVPPEVSQWRRLKLHLPDGSEEVSAAPALAGAYNGSSRHGSSDSNGSGRSRRRRSSSSSMVEGMREVPYWGREFTRYQWHNRLGNLILVQPLAQGSRAPGSHTNADFEVKAAHWASCAADEHFPEFSGSVVAQGGCYNRDCFSPDECRARHGDIVDRLVEVFGLRQL